MVIYVNKIGECLNLKCPKCNGENVEVSREEKSSTGATFGMAKGKPGITGKNIHGHGLSSSSSTVHYQTTALCKDCGYSWHPVGADDEKNKNMALGCLVVVIFVIILVVIFMPK